MNEDGLLALFLGFIGTFFILWIAIAVFILVVDWKLYEKAGKPGWAALIPIYNVIVLFDIIGYKWYYIFFLLLSCIPVVGQTLMLLFSISYNIKLAKSFGKSVEFGFGLCFLKPIFSAIIAFNKDIKYVGKTVNGDIDFNDLF